MYKNRSTSWDLPIHLPCGRVTATTHHPTISCLGEQRATRTTFTGHARNTSQPTYSIHVQCLPQRPNPRASDLHLTSALLRKFSYYKSIILRRRRCSNTERRHTPVLNDHVSKQKSGTYLTVAVYMQCSVNTRDTSGWWTPIELSVYANTSSDARSPGEMQPPK